MNLFGGQLIDLEDSKWSVGGNGLRFYSRNIDFFLLVTDLLVCNCNFNI